MKANQVIEALRRFHTGRYGVLTRKEYPPRQEVGRSVAFFEELRVGTGYSKGAEQRIDAWVINLWASRDLARIAYEVKVSRSDFLAELRNPPKRKYALLYSNYFYFAAPEGLIRPEELPPEAGLMEVLVDDDGPIARKVVEAPWRDVPPPPWRFVAALARRCVQAEAEALRLEG